jgi:predicted permease
VALTLVIGLGLNAAIFSVLNGMVFSARIEKNPSTFVQILTDDRRNQGEAWKTSLGDYLTFQKAQPVRNLEAWAVVHTTIDDRPEDNLAMLVSCGFFTLYGLEVPLRGRILQSRDCAEPGSRPLVMISEELWKRDFSSDPAIVGRTVLLNHHPYTVIGIAPARFSGRLRGAGIWIPYTMEAHFFGGADPFTDSSTPWLTIEGRLTPGYSRSRALTELSLLAPHLSISLTNGSLLQHPSSAPAVKWVVPLTLGAFGLILLLACANVTMLLLSRATARRKEMAIRLSLGASRRALVSMLITEGILLSSCAGALSLGLVAGVPLLFERVMWRAPHYTVKPDWPVFGYLAMLTLLAGVVTGLAPAAESFKVNVSGSLKGEPFKFRWPTRDTLIAGQVATSLVLLIGAALFARAEFAMVAVRPNFETRRVLQVPLNTRAAFPPSLEAALMGIDGVSSVCFTSIPPFVGRSPDVVTLDGQQVAINNISPACFATLGIPMIRGSAESLVVSQAFARRQNIMNRSILGKHISGVAQDLTYIRAGTIDGPVVYQPGIRPSARDFVLVRVNRDPEIVARTISRVLLTLDPNQTAVPFSLSSRIDEMASRFAVIEVAIVVIGGVALTLAVIGIYGVVGFAVLCRMKELGIRLALGARTIDLLKAVVGPGLKPLLRGLICGAAFGAAGSFGLERIFRNSPVSLEIANPLPYFAVSLLLIATAIAAMVIPGLRAAVTVPADALRED